MSGSGSQLELTERSERAKQPDQPASALRTTGALHSASVAQTRRLGAALGALLAPGDVILLEGELGAGKTALTQGIGAGMGVQAVINSPTFTILKEYTSERPSAPMLFHFDLYRIEDPDEVYALGFADVLGGEGVCVVEWAERGAPHAPATPTPWPADYLRIRLRRDDPRHPQQRLLEAHGVGPRGARLLTGWLRAVGTNVEQSGGVRG